MFKDGFIEKIYYRYWSVSDPVACIFAIHGFGGHSIWFDNAAKHFNENKINFFSFDLPGFGQSKYERGYTPSYKFWIESSFHILKSLKHELGFTKPVFILGHSMGALISILLSLKIKPEGLILTVPGFEGAKSCWPSSLVLSIMINSIVNPKKEILVPFGPDILTRNREKQLEMKGDPYRVIKPQAKSFFELKLLGIKAQSELPKLKTPLLLIKAGNDLVCSNTAMDSVYEKFKMPDKNISVYEGLYHDIFMEDEINSIVNDISSWVKNRLA